VAGQNGSAQLRREFASGRANGSILSLVNRAVKSNIFMNDWKGEIFMATTWSRWI